MAKPNFHLRNITDGLKATDIFWIYRNKSVVPVKGLSIDSLAFGEDTITLNKNLQVNGNVSISGSLTLFDLLNVRAINVTRVDTAITETIDVTTCTTIRQTAAGITTSLSGVTEGTAITIINDSNGNNVITETIDDVVNPTIYCGETFDMEYNGTNWNLT